MKARDVLRASMSEREFQELVVDIARARGWRVYHTYDSRRSAPGFPDLVIARRGTVIFAELKTQAGPVRAEQSDWLFHLGDRAYIWRPSDMDRIESLLR